MSISTYAFILIVGILPMIPAAIFFVRKSKSQPVVATKGLLVGLGSMNIIVGLLAFAIGVVWFLSPGTVQAAAGMQAAAADPYASLAAAAATSVAAVASGFAVSNTGTAALGTIAERPELFGQSLIFVGLAEGIAIYGLLISFLILNS